MDQALLARSQMALSLAFHIVFASIGVAMPVLMVLAEACGLRSRDAADRAAWMALAHRWAKGTAVLFAVGAVSGTVLSFELGLLFPGFMRLAGPIIGLPFSMEGFAFFIEAIFLGIYLYGWDRLPPHAHLWAGVGVAVSGLASAVFVTFVNAWMNAPVGYVLEGGTLTQIDPWAALQTPYALHEILHSTLAYYAATGLAVAGVHAFALWRYPGSGFHRRALTLALCLAVPPSLLQPVVGHYAGQQVAIYQPAKLAAMEQLRETQARAPMKVGPFEIPGALSFMAFNDFDATVKGLDAFAADDVPPPLVRPMFLIMVTLGTALFGYALWALWLAWRKRALAKQRVFLVATMVAAPAGFIALEAGWILTEVGRQPWVVYGVLRTAAAVTPAPGLGLRLVLFTFIYIVLGTTVAIVLGRHVRSTLHEADVEAHDPHGPRAPEAAP
jgi:cytochrome d ubiquinol oxidase subunit I